MANEVAQLVIQKLISEACVCEDYKSASLLVEDQDLRESICIFTKKIIAEDRRAERAELCSDPIFMSAVTCAVREMLRQNYDFGLEFLSEDHNDVSELQMPDMHEMELVSRDLNLDIEFDLDPQVIPALEILSETTGIDWQTCESIVPAEEERGQADEEQFERQAVTYVESEGAARLIKRYIEHVMELSSIDGPTPQYELAASNFDEIKTVIGVCVSLDVVCDPTFQTLFKTFRDQIQGEISSCIGHVTEYRLVFAKEFTEGEILVGWDLRREECNLKVNIASDLSILMCGSHDAAFDYVKKYDSKRGMYIEMYQVGFNSYERMMELSDLINRIGRIVYGDDKLICKAGLAPQGYTEGLEFNLDLVANIRFREFVRQNIPLRMFIGDIVDDDREGEPYRRLDRKDSSIMLPGRNAICYQLFLESLVDGFRDYFDLKVESAELLPSLERRCDDGDVHRMVDTINILVISEDLDQSLKFMNEAFNRFNLEALFEDARIDFGFPSVINIEEFVHRCAQKFSGKVSEIIERLGYSE